MFSLIAENINNSNNKSKPANERQSIWQGFSVVCEPINRSFFLFLYMEKCSVDVFAQNWKSFGVPGRVKCSVSLGDDNHNGFVSDYRT